MLGADKKLIWLLINLALKICLKFILTEFEFLGLGAAALDDITDQYLAVTKKAANEAVRKYMCPDRAVTIIAGTLDQK